MEYFLRHGVFGYKFNKWYVAQSQRDVLKALKKCMKYVSDMSEVTMTLRQCLEYGGWYLGRIKAEKMREAIDYFMFDFENAGTPEKMSAVQMSYTGEGKMQIFITLE